MCYHQNEIYFKGAIDLMDKSLRRANEIIKNHLKNIAGLQVSIKAIILVGSLSNNSYIGKAGSDIDLIHIVTDDCDYNVRNSILSLIEKTQIESNNDIPISKCVYRYVELFRPFKTDFELSLCNKDYIELPIEIFRIKDSGVVIYGDDIIENIDTPTRDEVITFQKISYEWSKLLAIQNPDVDAKRQELLKNPSVRMIAQIVITGAMMDYYFATNKSCSSKFDIAIKMKTDVAGYYFQNLLDLVAKWRYETEDFNNYDEQELKSLFKNWFSIRNEKGIDYVPILI